MTLLVLWSLLSKGKFALEVLCAIVLAVLGDKLLKELSSSVVSKNVG